MSSNLDTLIEKVSEYSDNETLSSLIQKELNTDDNTPGLILRSLSQLYNDVSITVGIERLVSTETSKYCVSQDKTMVFSILSDMTVRVLEYEIDSREAPTGLKLVNSSTYGFGEIVTLNRSAIYLVEVVSGGVVIMGEEKDGDDVKRTYCLETGNLVSTVGSSNHHSKLQFAADLLGRFPDKSSLVPLKKLLRHKAYFVRWQAAQSFALIATLEETIEMLHELCADPHAHIRDAAAKSLQKVGG